MFFFFKFSKTCFNAKTPEGSLPYAHKECIEDFAGNSSQPGAWADVYEDENGKTIITFGGNWKHYCEDGVLDKFMDGERGLPVEARQSKVKTLYKNVDNNPEESWEIIIAFLKENKDELKFGEEFKWS